MSTRTALSRPSLAADVVLRDGSTIRLRPVDPDDRPALEDLGARLGDLRYRFQGDVRSSDPASMAMLAAADFRSSYVLVAETGRTPSRLVALARAALHDSAHAEVALVTLDPLRGRGIGTRMLERLAEILREDGVSTFEAEVETDNAPLLDVFLKSGFEVERRSTAGGIYHLTLSLQPTPAYEELHARRSRAAAAASMRPFLAPRSVAVVGASARPGSIGHTIHQNLVLNGFQGVVYPVNPSTPVIGCTRAYPTVRAIPEPVDLAVIVVPAEHVEGAVDDCIAAGVRAIVLITAGFAETGPAGRRREAALVERIRAAGVRLIGPNCMGILNTDPAVRLNASFSPVHPPTGRIAMLTQSGALGLAVLDYAKSVGLGFSSFVSFGNKADVSGNDLLQFWMEDPNTDVILLYLESFGNPRRFAQIARNLGEGRTIVAVKSGRSQAGARAASSHSGALASVENAVEAMFRQVGIIRTDTLEQMFDVAMLLARQPPPRGRRVAVITNAGGPAILAADACEGHGLTLPPLSDETVEALRSFLPAMASVANPIDMISTADADCYARAIAAALADDGIDSVLVIFIPRRDCEAAPVLEAIERASAEAAKPLLLAYMHAARNTLPVSLPVYAFPESAVAALAHVTRHAEWRSRPRALPIAPAGLRIDEARAVISAALEKGGGWLEPAAIARLAAAAGIAIPSSRLVGTADEAERAAREIGFPIVLKAVGATILHKSDVGGVITGLSDAASLRRACEEMRERLGADLEQFLVQAQVRGRAEVLIGATVDPTFGPLVLYGSGGVLVELLHDVSFRLTPLSDRDLDEMLDEVKGTALLRGFRGAPPADEGAVRDLLARLSALLEACPEIQEVDLNPVMVLERGALAVDTRIRVERRPPPAPSRRIVY
jgi:acetyl coenzyme A synthetase (ADP forming)-like protein